MVVCVISPPLFSDPSTFWAGSGLRRVRRVKRFCRAKVSWIIIPSAPLSTRVCALISFPLSFPTSLTLRAIDGDRIFLITSEDTGSESKVSRMA